MAAAAIYTAARHRPHAVRRRAGCFEQEITRELATVGYEVISDPLTEFREFVSEMRAFHKYSLAHIAALNDNLVGTDKKGVEYLRAILLMYERASDCVGQLAKWVQLGIEERVAAITERQVGRTRGRSARRRPRTRSSRRGSRRPDRVESDGTFRSLPKNLRRKKTRPHDPQDP